MRSVKSATVDTFNQDIATNRGYLYTTKAGLSSHLANLRLTDAALELFDFNNKKVLDVGCGDGAYTFDLFDRGKTLSITGIDPAESAIKIAKLRSGGRNIVFESESADALPYPDNSFDLVHIRGVLHHMKDPNKALKEALRVAPVIMVIEPNGYNPILKLIERFSPYHVRHGERSYSPLTMRKWVNDLGGRIGTKKYIGLVPFFCPDPLARLLKIVEPLVEKTPVARQLLCAVYAFVATRDGNELH